MNDIGVLLWGVGLIVFGILLEHPPKFLRRRQKPYWATRANRRKWKKAA